MMNKSIYVDLSVGFDVSDLPPKMNYRDLLVAVQTHGLYLTLDDFGNYWIGKDKEMTGHFRRLCEFGAHNRLIVSDSYL